MIEDNPADALLVQEALEEHAVECELICITDGERAIEFIQSLDVQEVAGPDLVILDLNLPRKSGSDVLEQIRSSPKSARVPVIVLSSSDHQRDRKEAAKLGASLYIRKPSNLAAFLGLGRVFKDMIDRSRI